MELEKKRKSISDHERLVRARQHANMKTALNEKEALKRKKEIGKEAKRLARDVAKVEREAKKKLREIEKKQRDNERSLIQEAKQRYEKRRKHRKEMLEMQIDRVIL